MRSALMKMSGLYSLSDRDVPCAACWRPHPCLRSSARLPQDIFSADDEPQSLHVKENELRAKRAEAVAERDR